MKTKLPLFAAALVSLALVSFKLFTAHEPAATPLDFAAVYQAAIVDAMAPEANEVCTTLVEISKANKALQWKQIDGEDYVLMVSWKGSKKYYEPYVGSGFYDTKDHPIWVSAAPELLTRMQNEDYDDADERLLQLLGLPPNAAYNYFIEFWVKPADLFRPCPDSEITDNQCSLCFPEDAGKAHEAWIDANRVSRYYPCELYNKYPWSQLGYTYDWSPNNPTHVGLSEFVIGTNKKIAVEGIYTTAEYLAKSP